LVKQLHGTPIRGIKDSFQMMAAIHDPNVYACLFLLADFLHKTIFCESDELFAESLGLGGFQSPRQIAPCQGVMPRYRRSREFFDGTWGKSVSIEMDFGKLGR
jgi:hypothetical protein